MANEERHDQVEAGDPFSVFAELQNGVSKGKRGLFLFESKLNELLFEVTMDRGQEGRDEARKKLIDEAGTIYTDNMERRQRAYKLIAAIREAHNKQS